MTTLSALIEAFIASRELDAATLSRLAFWDEALGTYEPSTIADDDVDAAVVRLVERGKLKPLPGGRTVATGKPLAGSTVNRYIVQLGSLFKYARRLRLLPRSHVPPTAGIEKLFEPPDLDRYLRAEEVFPLLAVARVVDTRWRRLPALIVLAFYTGLRKTNLLHSMGVTIELEDALDSMIGLARF